MLILLGFWLIYLSVIGKCDEIKFHLTDKNRNKMSAIIQFCYIMKTNLPSETFYGKV